MKKFIIIVAILGAIGFGIFKFSEYGACDNRSITVSGFTDQTFVIEADTGTRVSGYVQPKSKQDNQVLFWITDPYGSIAVEVSTVRKSFRYNFTASYDGEYRFHFRNSSSATSSGEKHLKVEICKN